MTEELSGSESQTAQNLVLPTCPTSSVPLSSPLHSGTSDQRLVAGDQCGHSSLLIGILAALSSGNPCGIQTYSVNSLRNIRISTSRAEPLTATKHSTCLPDTVNDALIEVYLQRVNPRYPFLHGDTFLEWYRSWKTYRHKEPTADQKDRWKDFFVVMVRIFPVLYFNGN